MSITVKLFATLRERYGMSETSLEFSEGISIPDLWSLISNGEVLPATVMMAVNMEYAKPDRQLQDGDEVAFFPPVSGG